jgi:hypothetical protein
MATPTKRAASIMKKFIREADRRPPHGAIDYILTLAERMEREQGGRLTEFQIRVAAAFLLAAAKLPPDVDDPHIVPEWLTAEDAELYGQTANDYPPPTA